MREVSTTLRSSIEGFQRHRANLSTAEPSLSFCLERIFFSAIIIGRGRGQPAAAAFAGVAQW